ncbi:hypothetical protein [Paraburkholderia solisilvae]|uniref:Uncharacterized protein n=1 Tax=Paraburkholderia solisilvae TaxID=624376 RepID=A0A6J5EF67_9BURK|nr:hypothetical protein [Paraburkholderia solisilvae]CAB3764397.1 hypothetical protein LMG29739_04346 [Paraburkholderia solisilvae]
MEPLTVASKAIGPVKAAITYFWRKWFPPRLGYRMAPSNILEIIGPYVHEPKVIEVLGQPHERHNQSAAYRFANALLQVNYDGDFVESVALVSLRLTWPNRFQIFPFRFKLGSSRFSDTCEIDENGDLDLRVNFSTKFFCLWNTQYFGHPGRYLYYSFALLEAATYPLVRMPKAAYEAAERLHIERGAKLRTVDSKFNAVMVSTKEDELFAFDFTMFN